MTQQDNSYKGIKSWAENDRPREKMIRNGAGSLSDAELIAILFGNGTKNQSAVDLARNVLLLAENDLNNLARKSIKEIQKTNGVGPAKAITLMAALELGKRRKSLEIASKTSIRSSEMAAALFYPILSDNNHELFAVLYLNTKNQVMHQELISKGGITATVVDIRIILKTALEHFATSIIIAHNHPSGNLQPSQADTTLTNKLKNACQIMDITLLDHIIIGHNAYYSFKDGGNL